MRMRGSSLSSLTQGCMALKTPRPPCGHRASTLHSRPESSSGLLHLGPGGLPGRGPIGERTKTKGLSDTALRPRDCLLNPALQNTTGARDYHFEGATGDGTPVKYLAPSSCFVLTCLCPFQSAGLRVTSDHWVRNAMSLGYTL